MSTRETERVSDPGPLPSVDYCTKSQTFLRWNKTSKWIVSMKHQDGWWYIVCAFTTVLIGVIGILHFQRQKSNSSFINTNGIVLQRNFAIVNFRLYFFHSVIIILWLIILLLLSFTSSQAKVTTQKTLLGLEFR